MSKITIKIRETVDYDELSEREQALYDEGYDDGERETKQEFYEAGGIVGIIVFLVLCFMLLNSMRV